MPRTVFIPKFVFALMAASLAFVSFADEPTRIPIVDFSKAEDAVGAIANGDKPGQNIIGRKADGNMTVSKDGGEVDAITAATISSRAYCDAVNRAAKAYWGIRTLSIPKMMPSLKINTNNAAAETEAEEKGADNE